MPAEPVDLPQLRRGQPRHRHVAEQHLPVAHLLLTRADLPPAPLGVLVGLAQSFLDHVGRAGQHGQPPLGFLLVAHLDVGQINLGLALLAPRLEQVRQRAVLGALGQTHRRLHRQPGDAINSFVCLTLYLREVSKAQVSQVQGALGQLGGLCQGLGIGEAGGVDAQVLDAAALDLETREDLHAGLAQFTDAGATTGELLGTGIGQR